jgi:hypothetical protein
MAIAFNATSQNRTLASSSNTVSHTCTGSDRLLLTFIECQNGDLITGVTYNGVSMTQLGKNNISAFGFYNYIYYLVAPATGANNIVVSASGSCTIIQLSESLTGVNQTTPIDASNLINQTSSLANPTGSVTTLTDNAWVVGSCRISSFKPTVSAGTTERNISSDIGYILYDKNSTSSPVGTYTLDTTSAAQTWYFWTLAIKPVSAIAIKSINGVTQAQIKSMNTLTNATIKSVNGVSNV